MYWTKRVAIISMIFFSVQGLSARDLGAASQSARSRHEAVVEKKREREIDSAQAMHPRKRVKRKVRRQQKRTRETIREERLERQKKYLEDREAKKQASLHEDFFLTPSQRKRLSSVAVEEKKLDHRERIARLREFAEREERRNKANRERAELLERLKVERREAKASLGAQRKEKQSQIVANNQKLRAERKIAKLEKSHTVAKSSEKKKDGDKKCGWFWWNSKGNEAKQKEQAERKAQKELSRVSRTLHKERLKAERANKLEALALEKKALRSQKKALKKK